MATQYLIANSLGQAQAQSKDYWSRVLGRDKHAQDVTELLSMCLENPLDNKALIVITDADYALVYPKLTPQEKAFADANLKPANDPYIVAALEAIAAENVPLSGP